MSLGLEITQIENTYTRENFKKIEILSKSPLINKPLSFYETKLPCATSNFKFPHNLGYTPKDIVITSILGTGAVTIIYANLDGTNVEFTTTGTAGDFLTVRFLLGIIA